MKKSLKSDEERMEEVAEKISKRFYKMATLFSGAGGLDSGFVSSGNFKMLLANDVLLPPARTYSKNYHHKIVEADQFSSKTRFPVYVHGDITKINFEHLGKLDCMVGGPPCQDFSITRGKSERKGIEVSRGKLYSHFVRALARTQPKVFFFENVPGLISANSGQAFESIKKDFANLNVRWGDIKHKIKNGPSTAKNYFLIFKGIVDASKVGVPQRRKRLIIAGVRNDLIKWPLEAELLERAENVLEGKKSLVSKYPLTTMEAFEGKTIPQLSKQYRKTIEEYDGVAGVVKTKKALGLINLLSSLLSAHTTSFTMYFFFTMFFRVLFSFKAFAVYFFVLSRTTSAISASFCPNLTGTASPIWALTSEVFPSNM